MKKSLLLILIILLTCRDLYTQWYKVTDPGFYQPISLDAYDDKNCIFSTSDDRSLYITKDGGITWHKIENLNVEGDYVTFNDISMISPDNIFLAASNGKIIATSNGGETWQIQFEDSTRTDCISYLEMFDENNGVAFGDAIVLPPPHKIYFFNNNLGWAIGNFIVKTTDGGETWIEQPRTSSNFNARNVFFLNESIGWIHDNSLLYKTSDGGNSWSLMGGIGSNNSMLIFFDENHGYRFSTGVMKTTDGGNTWSNKTSHLVYNNISFMNFVDKDTGWIIISVSGKSTLLGTVNGGDEWNVIKTFDFETPRRILFTNKNNGYSYYSKTVSSNDFRSYFLRTTDGGFNWSSTEFENEYISHLQVFNGTISDTVIIFQENKMLSSTDNGITWDVNQFEEFQSSNRNFTMINSRIGFADGWNRSIYKTANSGKSWNLKYQVPPTSAVILNTTNGGKNWNYVENTDMLGWVTIDYSRRIDFVDMNTGYFRPQIIGETPPQTMLKTTNGGLTWDLTTFKYATEVVKFYSPDFGIIATVIPVDGIIKFCLFVTRDGGANYDTVVVSDNNWGQAIEFHKNDPSKVWCSNLNSLFYSADSGKSWIEHSFLFGPMQRIQHIKFVDNSIGWIAANGFILRTTNAGGVYTSIENELSLPNNFQLHQNYPNPFNPTTTIKYSIPAEMNRSVATKLKVYDLLGSEVAVLVNEEKAPGNYEVNFDGTGLPSGIYFYTIKSGSFNSSRKMILLK